MWWRPIYGSATLYYTSLREQHVYKRAAKLFYAAFERDPCKESRTRAAWLRRPGALRAQRMAVERGGKRDVPGLVANAVASPRPRGPETGAKAGKATGAPAAAEPALCGAARKVQSDMAGLAREVQRDARAHSRWAKGRGVGGV